MPGDLSTTDLNNEIDAADTALTRISALRANLQNQLAEALSTDTQTDTFVLLKLRQQLTETLARESLVGLEKALAGRGIQKGSSTSGGFFGSTYDFGADGSVFYPGWYVKWVKIGGDQGSPAKDSRISFIRSACPLLSQKT